jgi:hypothetical protein
MTEPTHDEEDPYVHAVRAKSRRMARARSDTRSVWVVLAQAGTVGWQFVLILVGCTLAGHAVGRLLDHDGPTLAGILVGLALALWQGARSLRSGWE